MTTIFISEDSSNLQIIVKTTVYTVVFEKVIRMLIDTDSQKNRFLTVVVSDMISDFEPLYFKVEKTDILPMNGW